VASNLFLAIFILGLSLFVKISSPPGWPLFMAVLSGPVYFLMWVFWWQSLKSGEISRSVAIFSTAPLFNALLAVLFLGEHLTSFKWLAIFLIVTGAAICSWENKPGSRFNFAYILAVLAAIFQAIGNVVSKFAMKEISPLTIYVICFYASLPLYLILLTKRGVLTEVKVNLIDKKVVIGLFFRSFILFMAILLFYLALASGPVSEVSAMGGTGPLFALFYSTIISLFWPKFIKEDLRRQVLLAKTVAIILIVAGVVLINS